MGGLNVRLVTGLNSTLVYTRSGSIGDDWIGAYARVNVSTFPIGTQSVQFYFEAVNVTSSTSNIAISGVNVRAINCLSKL